MPSDDESNERLLNSSSIYRRDPRRFYVLLIFAHLAFNQCLIWLTFSPIARCAQTFYGIDESTVDLLLNWGPIVFLPCLPLSYILLNKTNGLKISVRLLAAIDLLAAAIRMIPLIFVKFGDENFGRISLIFLHIGQILNAACGPLVMAPVSQLSCLWFAPEERTRATAFAIFANNFGSTIGFLISPLIVSTAESIPKLLCVHLGLAVSAFLLTFLFFPSRPRSPPSAAAELLLEDNRRSISTIQSDLNKCFTNRSFILITLSGGLLSGAFASWTSLFDIILKEEQFSEQEAGWFGFSASIFGILGGFISSSIADRSRFQHSLKSMIIVALCGCFISIGLFELSVPSLFTDRTIFPATLLTIGLSTSSAGFFSGAAIPLIYESLSELMYPLRESLSTSILVQMMNVVAVVFLFIAPNRSKLINMLVPIVILVDVFLILLSEFSYQRRDEDHRRKIENEQNSTVDANPVDYRTIENLQ